MRHFLKLHPDAINLLKVKDFKIKPLPDIEFTDTEGRSSRDNKPFTTSKEKMTVYKKWISFLNGHFKQSSLSKALYQQLHLHCRYIAHYDIHGFYQTYFEFPHMLHAAIEPYGKDSEKVKRWWISIYQDIAFGERNNDSGLGSFYYNWSSMPSFYYTGDYGDLIRAMADVFEKYIDLWEEVIEEANDKLKQISHEPDIKEKQAQRKRLQQTIVNANSELQELEKELAQEIQTAEPQDKTENQEQPPTLFDFMNGAA